MFVCTYIYIYMSQIIIDMYIHTYACDCVCLQMSIRNIPMWVVVKIRVPFWVLTIVRHLVFRVPKQGP